MPEYTDDTLFNGLLQIRQETAGYRFSIDAVLVAGFVRPTTGNIILDLGTGCGIIPLILGFRFPDSIIYGIEIEESLVQMAQFNVHANSMNERITIWQHDLRHAVHKIIPEQVDIVVTNPPFRKVTAGRINPNRQRAVAKHEIKANLQDITVAAQNLLGQGGCLLIIYPVFRMVELMISMRSAGIEPKTIRMVHSRVDSKARVALVKGIKGGSPGLTSDEPLIIYGPDKTLTRGAEKFYEY